VLGIDRFGSSAPGDTNLHEFGFTVDEVCRRAQAVLSSATASARR
jgi:transketolase